MKILIVDNFIPAARLIVIKNLLASKLANSSILYWPSSPARFMCTESQKAICSRKYALKIFLSSNEVICMLVYL